MTDEFDHLLEEVPPERYEPPPEAEVLPPEQEDAPSLADVRATLTTASALLPSGYDQDEGDFEPGGRYKGFEILLARDWPSVQAHAHLSSRFYVRHNDTVGLVPWPGSQIVWPWDQGWEQDLHRTEVVSYLKEDEKKGRKR